MRLFEEGALKQASREEVEKVLKLPILEQQVSIWKPGTRDGFVFSKNVTLSYLVRHLEGPDLLHPSIKETVEKVMSGRAPKQELFGFCVATFRADEGGWVRRLKHDYCSYTKLVQLDLDLKNEPNCTTDYVESVIQDIYELTDLGKHVLLCGKSISQKGAYLYLQCDTDELSKLEVVVKKTYQLLQQVFNFKNPEKTLDPSVSDIISRVRYFAPDRDLIINPNVLAVDTSGIRVGAKRQYRPSTTSTVDAFREQEIIRDAENRLLKGYHQTLYVSGLHNDFLHFANSCLGRGVSRSTLEKYTQNRFGQLYNQDKKKNYLPELMRVIDNAEKYILRG